MEQVKRELGREWKQRIDKREWKLPSFGTGAKEEANENERKDSKERDLFEPVTETLIRLTRLDPIPLSAEHS